MIKKTALIVLLITCALFAQASAQSVAETEKQAAIRELVVIMNSSFKASDMINMMEAQSDEAVNRFFKAALAENKELTDEQKKEFEVLLYDELIEIPKRYQEKILKRIDIDALTDQMIISLYDKHFTLSEVKDLLIFYRSATGQKILKTTPLLMEEMLRDMTEKLIPQVMEITKEYEADMKREVELKVKKQVAKVKQK